MTDLDRTEAAGVVELGDLADHQLPAEGDQLDGPSPWGRVHEVLLMVPSLNVSLALNARSSTGRAR